MVQQLIFLSLFRLILEEHVKQMKPGSVIVDLAAESGGNVATTVPGKVVTVHDVVHIGLTDLSSRLPTQSSTLYANNVSKFLLSIGEQKHFNINLEDEVVRGSIVLNNGTLMWPPPVVPVAAAPPPVKTGSALVKPEPPNPFNDVLRNSLTYTAGLGGLLALGYASPGKVYIFVRN